VTWIECPDRFLCRNAHLIELRGCRHQLMTFQRATAASRAQQTGGAQWF